MKAAKATIRAERSLAARRLVDADRESQEAIETWTMTDGLYSAAGLKAVALRAAVLSALGRTSERAALLDPILERLTAPTNGMRDQVKKCDHLLRELAQQSLFEEALVLSDHVVAEEQDGDPRNVAKTLEYSSYLLEELERFDDAWPQVLKSLELFEQTSGPDSGDVYRVLRRAGQVAYHRDDVEESERLLDREYEMRTHGRYEDPLAHRWLWTLAESKARLDKFDEAVALYEQALPGLKDEYGVESVGYLNASTVYAYSLSQVGRLDEALERQDRNVAAWAHCYGEHSEEVSLARGWRERMEDEQSV